MRRPLTIMATVALCLTLGACGGKEDDGGSPASGTTTNGPSADTAAAKLRGTLTGLLTEHAYLAAIAADTATRRGADDPDTSAARAAVMANSGSIADLLGSAFGGTARSDFLSAWSRQAEAYVAYTEGKLGEDETATQQALTELDTSRDAIASAIIALSPGAQRAKLTADLKTHIESELAAIDAAINDSSEFPEKLAEAAAHMPATAQLLAQAVAGKRGARPAGDPDSEGAALRSGFVAALVDATQLALLTSDGRIAKGVGSTRARTAEAAALASLETFSEVFSSVYGEDGGQKVLSVMKKQLRAYERYATGKATKDLAPAATALTELDAAREAYGSALHALDPKTSAVDASAAIGELIDASTATIRAQAAGSDKRFERLAQAAQRAAQSGGDLAVAITKQFPDRFNG